MSKTTRKYMDDHPDLQLLQRAWLRGSAFDPNEPNAMGIEYDDLPKLDLEDPRGIAMMRSWHFGDASIDNLVRLQHGREPQLDGLVGPATRTLATIPRCGLPDKPPPEGVQLAVYGEFDEKEDPETGEGGCSLRGAVESYRNWKLLKPVGLAGELPGGGSWPSCDPNRDKVHSVRVNLDTSQASALQKELLEDTIALVRKCEAEIGQAVRYILNGNPKEAEHDVAYEFIAGGVIGYAYFPRPNTCDQVVKSRLDNSWNPNSARTHFNLHDHEYKGHSDGLEHTRGGRMNPSIIPELAPTWIGDPHEQTKRRYFGGKPVPIDDTPGPGPGPTPTPHNKLVFRGGFEAEYEGQKLPGRYYLVHESVITG